MIDNPHSRALRYAQTMAIRETSCQYKMNSADIIVLHKFQKEYPHLIIPFGEAEWTTKSVPFNTNINILPMIQLANVKKIDFNGVYKRFNIIIDVIWSISSILLPNLQILKLSENFIITIEPLIAIKAPQIRELDLSENLITSIKPLRKCNFPCLSWLCLNRNPITNYESIAEIKFMRNCTCYLNYQHQELTREWWSNQMEVANEDIPSVLYEQNKDTNFLFKASTNSIYMHFTTAEENKQNIRCRALMDKRKNR